MHFVIVVVCWFDDGKRRRKIKVRQVLEANGVFCCEEGPLAQLIALLVLETFSSLLPGKKTRCQKKKKKKNKETACRDRVSFG